MKPSPSAEAGDVSALSSLDDPVRRRLYDYVCEQGGPVSRDEASAAAGIGRTLAAYHLDKLEGAGLLTAAFQRPEGRGGPGAGRPAKLYTRADREFAVTVPPRDYELLTHLLLESAERDGSGVIRGAAGDAAERAGRTAGREARESAPRTGRPDAVITAALRGCGYQPSVQPDGDIALRNCPFDRAARTHRDIVCGLNLRMLRGVLEGTGDDPDRAALEPLEGRCCVVVRARG